MPSVPLVGPTMPSAWASTAHQAGIHRTSAGQQVPVRRAMSAQKLGLISGKTSVYSLQLQLFAQALSALNNGEKSYFDDTSMIH